METLTSKTSSAELATEASSYLVGLGILSLALFPFVLPGLLLALVLALPLVLPAVPVLLIWLVARGVVRALRSSRESRRLTRSVALERGLTARPPDRPGPSATSAT